LPIVTRLPIFVQWQQQRICTKAADALTSNEFPVKSSQHNAHTCTQQKNKKEENQDVKRGTNEISEGRAAKSTKKKRGGEDG
jgi:hypothetical protein